MSNPDRKPLYARLLRLKHLTPSGFLCFAFLEGAVALGILLALAELVSWWGVLVLPALVAVMVKLNDVVAGLVTRAPAPAPALTRGSAPVLGSAPALAGWDAVVYSGAATQARPAGWGGGPLDKAGLGAPPAYDRGRRVPHAASAAADTGFGGADAPLVAGPGFGGADASLSAGPGFGGAEASLVAGPGSVDAATPDGGREAPSGGVSPFGSPGLNTGPLRPRGRRPSAAGEVFEGALYNSAQSGQMSWPADEAALGNARTADLSDHPAGSATATSTAPETGSLNGPPASGQRAEQLDTQQQRERQSAARRYE